MGKCLKDFANKAWIWLTPLAIIFGLLFISSYFQDSYKSRAYIPSQCQVDSIDVRYHRRKDYRIHYKVRMIDESRTTHVFWISQGSARSKSDAWEIAEKYQINQTYPCYGPLEPIKSIPTDDWQWSSPFASERYNALYFGIVLLILGLISLILGAIYKAKCLKICECERERQQVEIPLRHEEQQQSSTVV